MNIPSLSRTTSQLTGSPVSGIHPYQLQLLQISDTLALFNLVEGNRTYLRQWLPWVDGTRSPDDGEAFILQTQQSLTQNTGLVLAIVTTVGRRIVGIVGLDPIDWPSRTGFIGYWLAEQYQSRGIMTASCQRLIHHAFTVLQLSRIVIACATENASSRAIPERLGFTYDGQIKQAEWLHDHPVDHEVYVLLRDAWESLPHKRNAPISPPIP